METAQYAGHRVAELAFSQRWTVSRSDLGSPIAADITAMTGAADTYARGAHFRGRLVRTFAPDGGVVVIKPVSPKGATSCSNTDSREERQRKMAHQPSDVLAVQSRLQELLNTMPAAQADLLETVIAGTPLEVRHDRPGLSDDADDASIIIVSGRRGRWLVFDLRDVLDDLNPQPLPPGPPDTPVD